MVYKCLATPYNVLPYIVDSGGMAYASTIATVTVNCRYFMLTTQSALCDVLPYMASLISKKKGNKLYYYVVESARVDGKPRIVQQTYLGTADRLADLLKQRTAPVPVSATTRDFGLPGAIWLAARRSGVWDVLKSMWPPEGPAHQRRIICSWRSFTA